MPSEIDALLDALERGRMSRRQVAARLAGLVALAAGCPPLRAAGDEPFPTFKATDINHVALSVTDVARSRAFYEKHLGLGVMSAGAGSTFLRCGKDFLALFRAQRAGMDHFCFTVEGYDPAVAEKRLEAAGIAPRRQADRVYFDDPDGLEVQVSAPNRPGA